ncbi:tyrosine-type recombinase/integrase [Adlercreutzia sp. ZJ141]|uniref:tyrosine-type recombinase/integrase n=1 Tax=Adlercreutzia sp. ZJ141 TaxID=2709406 RepID=UPI0013EDECF9|nr:tyrosine-type recombinase/integrase [Adlercreutzia sp. ZJ141]
MNNYVAYKRSLGYKIKIEAATLERFALYADSEHAGKSLSSSLVLAWIKTFESASDWYCARLYETVHTFSRYACLVDEGSTLLPKGRGKCHGKNNPYIYEDNEIEAMMSALSKIYSPDGLRAKSASTMCGLMRSCGLRPSECTHLTISNYDASKGVIDIIATKFNRSRRVPLSDSAARVIETHLSSIPASCADLPMFPRNGGRPFDVRALEYAWQITRDVLLPEGENTWSRRPPRPYDVRHTFVTKTLEGWLAAGKDINAMMPYLSAYLGHQKIADTYWYLSATEGLLKIASNLFEEYAGGGCHD